MDKQPLAGFVVFVLACMCLAFLAGIFAAIFQVFPYPPIQQVVSQVAASMTQDSGKGDLHFLYRIRNADSGVTVLNAAKAQPGITLVTGMWNDDGEWHPEVRLLDLEGQVLHRWQIYPQKIWPESPHDDWVKGAHNQNTGYVHGSVLLPNGDIIVNIEYVGMVRMNACGDIKWTVPLRLHHSIHEDDDGNFWAAGLYWREQAVAEYVHLKPPFVEEMMVKISPDGEVLREISILDVLYRSGYQGTIDSNKKKFDMTHMNDVEVLSAELAGQFPGFNAGDIMVSLRNYNMVLVIDGETEQVKWHFRHPLIHQHDPDFETDGSVVIFDNNDDTTREGSLGGQTQLLRVDPVTGSYERIYPLSDEDRLYTQEGGKHQLLANGNRLITEANAGRVLEVTPAGETVWNWVIDSRAGDYLPEVLEGTRYPATAADFIPALSCQ
jgi:hypothetical protein